MNAEQVRDRAQALYGGDVHSQQEAAKFYFEFMNMPGAAALALEVVSRFSDLYSNYAALYVLESVVERSWGKCDDEFKGSLRDVMIRVIEDPARSGTLAVSASRVLARIGLHEYPERWRSFVRDCLAASHVDVLTEFLELLVRGRAVTLVVGLRAKAAVIQEIGAFKDFFLMNAESGLKLMKLLLEWGPLDVLLTRDVLSVLLDCLRAVEYRSDVIKCLDIAFVQRLNSADIMKGPMGKHIVAGICGVAQNDHATARLLSDVLIKHLDHVNLEPEGVTKEKDVQMAKEFNLRLISQALEVLLDQQWADDKNQYFAFWGKVLEYFDNPNRTIDVKVIDALRNQLIRKMFEIVKFAVDLETVINNWACTCCGILCKVYETQMITFLREEVDQNLSTDVLMVAVAAIEHLPADVVLSIAQTFVEKYESHEDWRATIVPCIAICVCKYQEEQALVDFFLTSVIEFLRLQDKGLIQAAIASLNYVSMKSNELFYANDNALLETLCSLLADHGHLHPGDSNLLAIFKLVAAVILQIPDQSDRIPFIEKALHNVVRVLLETDPASVLVVHEAYVAANNALDILIDFGRFCCTLADAYGSQILPVITPWLNAINSEDQIIQKLYQIASILVSNTSQADEQPHLGEFFSQIITSTEHHVSTRGGYLLKLLSDTNPLPCPLVPTFSDLYAMFVRPLLIEPNADTEYALEWMNTFQSWTFGLEFPLHLLGDHFTLLSYRAGIQFMELLENYLKQRSDSSRTFVDTHGVSITNFIFGVICNPQYTRQFHLETHLVCEFALLCKAFGMTAMAFGNAVFEILSTQYLQPCPDLARTFVEYLVTYYDKVSTSDTFLPELRQNVRTLLASTNCMLSTYDSIFTQTDIKRLDYLEDTVDDDILEILESLC